MEAGVCDQANESSLIQMFLSWISLLDDSPLNKTKGRKPFLCYTNFLKFFLSRKAKDSIKFCSNLADNIMTDVVDQSMHMPNGRFLAEMASLPIYKEYIEWYKSGDPALFQYILTFLRFAKKMDYLDEEFFSTAFRGWMEIEVKLSTFVLPREPEMRILKRLVHYLLGNNPIMSVSDAKFGTGNVSEYGIRGTAMKASTLILDPMIIRVLRMAGTKVPDYSRSLPEELRYMDTSTHQHLDGQYSDAFSGRPLASKRHVRRSRVKFVRKNIKTARSICMEPNDFMLAQQMVLKGFVRQFESGPMSSYVNLRD